ncbi:MAG: ABC transporter substrate-binding protein [Leptospiraceae bacterium]|nr:ABC transporter substrate-binding protein [Leptospiraceae bacterium]
MKSIQKVSKDGFNLKDIALLLACFLILPLHSEEKRLKVVSLNGSLTEMIYAFGKEDVLVGADTTSFYPEEAKNLPKVGYQRSLSLEGILSLEPNLVVGTEEAGPPEILDRLRSMGVSVLIHKSSPSLASTVERIQWLGELLDAKDTATRISRRIQKNVNKASTDLPWKEKPRILMLYSRGKNLVMVAGKETSGSAIIELSGGENYIHEFTGYKTLTPELLLKKETKIILITEHSLNSLGGVEELWKLPGFKNIPLSKRPKIVSMEDLLLLGFSTRLDQAVNELQIKIKNSL